MAKAAFALIALGLALSACGTQNISVPSSQADLHAGAVLFNQRCSGCHTLYAAATQGSAANVRHSQYNNGPNFNVRCERPVDRVLYAIANGGFSGQIMPQNVVVGQDAVNVAEFVAKYSGRYAPNVPGSISCARQQLGTVLLPASQAAAASSATTTQTQTTPAQGGIPGAQPPKLAHPSKTQTSTTKK